MSAVARRGLLARLDGPQDLGHGPVFWGVFAVVALALLAFPLVGSPFHLSNLASFLVYVPMGLGLALLWGYGGILSFGQGAFFGMGGYLYGILVQNLATAPGAALLAVLVGVVVTILFAAAFGYFVFYGEVSAWIVPLLTLVLSLILETFMGQTAGYQWRIGHVLLGGYNGMTGIPSIRVGSLELGGASAGFYLVTVVVMLLAYLGLRLLANSHYGYVLVGVREDVERTRMLGYSVALRQVQVFALAAGLASVSGILYVSWGNYINPASMGLYAATLPVIWTAVGGRSSLLAVALSTVALKWLSDALAVRGGEYAFLIMGALLLGTMLFFPAGIVVALARRWRRWRGRGADRRAAATPEPARASRQRGAAS